MTGVWRETARGMIHPWLCDAQGHMSARNYAAFFDEASWAVLSILGYRASMAEEDRLGWAELKHVTDFKREAAVGGFIAVESTVVRTGRSSLTIRHRLIDPSNTEELATFEGITVAFDLEARASRALPDDLKANAEAVFAVSGWSAQPPSSGASQ